MSLKKINNKFWVIGKLFKNKHFHVIFPAPSTHHPMPIMISQQQWPPQWLWFSMMMFRPLLLHVPGRNRTVLFYYSSRTPLAAHVKITVWQQCTGNNREGRTAGERSGPATADDNNKTTWQGPVAPLAPERMTYIQPLAKCVQSGGGGVRGKGQACPGAGAGGGGGGFSLALVTVVTESPSASKSSLHAVYVCMGMWIFRWDGLFFFCLSG